MTLSDAEVERYSRQLVMGEWSGEAQEALKAASVIVIGAGALGSPALTYLVAAGVGRVGVVDPDDIELSNLHRQPLHLTPDLGGSKAVNAAVKLAFLNPEVQIDSYPVALEAANAAAIVAGASVVVDCSDSFATRYDVNDACCAERVPLVEGGVAAWSALVLSVKPGESACYRCSFPVHPPEESCAETGVVGALAGVIGSIQALEAIKLISGVGEPLLDTILQLDGRTMEQTLVATERQPGCAACGALSH
ncbi:MAG: HesA/MoeB/ThiF family protein [Thermoleophilaceae bacterium]|nr:HesA/MoeB/ThiF family protein [Thermoleophilaceae bacterium]